MGRRIKWKEGSSTFELCEVNVILILTVVVLCIIKYLEKKIRLLLLMSNCKTGSS